MTEAAISCANNDVLVLSYTDLSTMTSDSKFDVKRDHFLCPQRLRVLASSGKNIDLMS